MSEFVNFYSEAVKKYNYSRLTSGKRKKTSAQGKVIRCRFCLSEAHIHDPSGMVHCEKCGNSFCGSTGNTYSIDWDSVQKMSGKQLYDAAFYDGTVIMPFLMLSAAMRYIKALLLLAGYWNDKGDKHKAEAYYKAASEESHEGRAAYIRYQFQQQPEYQEYPDLLVELHQCLKKPFYVLDPNIFRDLFEAQEKIYIQYCSDECVKRVKEVAEQERMFWEQSHSFVEKDEYIDDDFYKNYYLPYLMGETKTSDDGADWNGMPWTANHINAMGV